MYFEVSASLSPWRSFLCNDIAPLGPLLEKTGFVLRFQIHERVNGATVEGDKGLKDEVTYKEVPEELREGGNRGGKMWNLLKNRWQTGWSGTDAESRKMREGHHLSLFEWRRSPWRQKKVDVKEQTSARSKKRRGDEEGQVARAGNSQPVECAITKRIIFSGETRLRMHETGSQPGCSEIP